MTKNMFWWKLEIIPFPRIVMPGFPLHAIIGARLFPREDSDSQGCYRYLSNSRSVLFQTRKCSRQIRVHQSKAAGTQQDLQHHHCHCLDSHGSRQQLFLYFCALWVDESNIYWSVGKKPNIPSFKNLLVFYHLFVLGIREYFRESGSEWSHSVSWFENCIYMFV